MIRLNTSFRFDNFVCIFKLLYFKVLHLQSYGKMFLRACNFVALLKFNVKPANSIGRFNFSSSPTRRKRKSNSRRSTHYTMLDKFTKQTSPDGSLIVKAPMNLKCSASYFDLDNQVDTNKNLKIGQSRQEANKIERANRRNRVYDDNTEPEEDFPEERRDPDNGAGIFMQSEHLASIRDISDVERNYLQSVVDKNMEQGSAGRALSRSPLQVSLWGRPQHRVDSYSIVSGGLTHTHMYVSDASTGEEAISMFSMESEGGYTVTPPTGQVDIWRPREVSQVDIIPAMMDESVRNEVVSRFKIHSPPHILSQEKNGISMIFRTPILMNKIFMEAERQGSIDLNGLLMDQLVTVGLVTEAGNIKISDIWAEEIKLASKTGDVMCYGSLEGNVRAETLGDGDFTARSVLGPRLDVVTDRGDICVWDDCHSESTQLFTNYGNITCNRLYSDAKICIKKEVNIQYSNLYITLLCFILISGGCDPKHHFRKRWLRRQEWRHNQPH